MSASSCRPECSSATCRRFWRARACKRAKSASFSGRVFAVKLVMGLVLAWWPGQAQREQLLLALAAWASVACGILLAMSERFGVVLASVICIAVCRNYF